MARDFEDRTRALDLLQENRLPITVVPVTIYEDSAGRRIVDVDTEHEPTVPAVPAVIPRETRRSVTIGDRGVTVTDLIDAGLLHPDEPVEFIGRASANATRP